MSVPSYIRQVAHGSVCKPRPPATRAQTSGGKGGLGCCQVRSSQRVDTDCRSVNSAECHRMKTVTQGVVLNICKETHEHATYTQKHSSHVQCTPYTPDMLCIQSLPSQKGATSTITPRKCEIPVELPKDDYQIKDKNTQPLEKRRKSEVPVKLLNCDLQDQKMDTLPLEAHRKSGTQVDLENGDTEKRDKGKLPLENRKGDTQGYVLKSVIQRKGSHQEDCCTRRTTTCFEGSTMKQVMFIFICIYFNNLSISLLHD